MTKASQTKRKVANPLALAVLVLLYERPMHPYEMAATLRERHKEESIKLRYGSLYTVIELLQRAGFIAAKKTAREGNRPERTVYGITPPGETEMREWLRKLLSTPIKEFPQFEAGLSLMPALPPEEVVELLQTRLGQLAGRIDKVEADMRAAREMNLPPLFAIESEYHLAGLQAEKIFVERMIPRIKADGLGFLKQWKEWHRSKSPKGKKPKRSKK